MRVGFSVAVGLLVGVFAGCMTVPVREEEVTRGRVTVPGQRSEWRGARVAFLGDSITDPRHIGTTTNYWQYLGDALDWDYTSFGVNGARFIQMLAQLDKAEAKYGKNLDALFLYAGTNDYMHDTPPGVWFTYSDERVNRNGRQRILKRRTPVMTDATFKGAVNKVVAEAKRRFPRTQIILVTPLHRGFATFGEKNVQPSECYANPSGYYIEDYMRVIREAGEIWSIPVIDLGGESGLFPAMPEYAEYFHNAATDMLHPNALGHKRIAETIRAQLTRIPRLGR